MFAFSSSKSSARPRAHFAFAIALLSGTALTAGVFEVPAAAQKKKDTKEEKADYSKEFVEAYTVANNLFSAEPSDVVGATAAIPGIIAAVKTSDDRMATGQFMVNVGQVSSDNALTLRGLELMLESGKIPVKKQASYLVNAGDLARRIGDMDKARKHLIAAHAAGHVRDDLPPIIANTYFEQNRYQEGVSYLRGLIDAQIAAGQTPNPAWVDVAFSSAYNNDLPQEAGSLSALAARYNPSERNWRNAIGLQRNLASMPNDVLLDLMRLSERTGTLNDERDYADYIEAANPRLLPGEVKKVLDAALAKGALEANDPFVVDARETSNRRIAADKADLPSLERDAMASGATAVTATAAGDVFLNYGDAAKAEALYNAALTKSDADTGRVLTRLGIAQVDQGKLAEADATFGKITGQRTAIAALWQAYVASKMAAPTPPATMSM